MTSAKSGTLKKGLSSLLWILGGQTCTPFSEIKTKKARSRAKSDKELENTKECRHCLKTFETTLQVIKHLDEVHDDIMHACVSCGIMFGQNKYKEKHMETCDEKCWKCWHCDQKFKRKQDMNQHIRSVHRFSSSGLKTQKDIENTKQCLRCSETFETTLLVIKHLEEIHDDIRHSCVMCGIMFINKGHKDKHMEKCEEKCWKCWECGKEFAQMEKLSSHIRGTHRRRLWKFKCDQCDKSYHRAKLLQTHIDITHNNVDLSLPCEICGKKYRHEKGLKKHIAYVHHKMPRGPRRKCELCNKEFKCKMGLKYHNRVVHSDLKYPFQCEHCGKEFLLENIMKKHIAVVHEKKKPYKCETCGKAFSQKFTRDSHVQIFHATIKKFVCEQCNHHCGDKAQLRDHIKFVHEKIPKHTCNYCGKTFVYPHNYRVHVKVVHEGKRDFKCEFCGMEFVRNKKLQAHIQENHSNEVQK